jgi:hypothetical protein
LEAWVVDLRFDPQQQDPGIYVHTSTMELAPGFGARSETLDLQLNPEQPVEIKINSTLRADTTGDGTWDKYFTYQPSAPRDDATASPNQFEIGFNSAHLSLPIDATQWSVLWDEETNFVVPEGSSFTLKPQQIPADFNPNDTAMTIDLLTLTDTSNQPCACTSAADHPHLPWHIHPFVKA